MNFEERMARAVDGLRRSVRETPVAPRRILLRRRRRAGLATTAAVAFVAVAVVAGQQLLQGGQETEVATRDQATEDTIPAEASPSGPVSAARGEEHCRPPDPPEGGEGTMTVWFYVLCGGDPGVPDESQLVALPRQVPRTAAVLRSAVEEYLKGITEDERRHGFRSFFPAEEDDLLVDVRVPKDGVAVIDFTEEFARLANISTSTAARSVLLTLGATVGQFDRVSDVVYRIEGDDENFCGYFELMEDCSRLYRPRQ